MQQVQLLNTTPTFWDGPQTATFWDGPLGLGFDSAKDGSGAFEVVTVSGQCAEQQVALGSKIIAVGGLSLQGMNKAQVASFITSHPRPFQLTLSPRKLDRGSGASARASAAEAVPTLNGTSPGQQEPLVITESLTPVVASVVDPGGTQGGGQGDGDRNVVAAAATTSRGQYLEMLSDTAVVSASSIRDATQYDVAVGETQDSALISVGEDGIRLYTSGRVLCCHWAWKQISFWVIRQHHDEQADDVVVIGIQPNPLSPSGCDRECGAVPGEISGSHSVLRLECAEVKSLCSDLTRYRPCGTPAAVKGSDREIAARLKQNRADLVEGPSCRLFPIQPETAAAYPDVAALRVCRSGLQITTHVDNCAGTQPPSVLKSWCWGDVAFWKFTCNEYSDGGMDTMDLLVIGLYGAAAAGLAGHDGGIALFRAEMEDTDAAHAMLEAHCPESPQFDVFVAAGHGDQLGHSLASFEVFKAPWSSGECQVDRETPVRLHIASDTGITLYEHEDFIPFGCAHNPKMLERWAWKSIVDCKKEKGDQEEMDLVRISILGSSPVILETEDGDPAIARFNEVQSSLGSWGAVGSSLPDYQPRKEASYLKRRRSGE
jgi:hypothetical protein